MFEFKAVSDTDITGKTSFVSSYLKSSNRHKNLITNISNKFAAKLFIISVHRKYMRKENEMK